MEAQPSWHIVQAGPDGAADALSILREVSQWLIDGGRPLWRVESFDLNTFRRAALEGELALGYEGRTAVASMLVQTRDALHWPNDPLGEALYVHKIAVRRSAAGRNWSRRLLAWAQTKARVARHAISAFDTADRQELLSLYRRCGFYIVDDRPRILDHLRVYRLELPIAK